jgi:hypothetical protein
MPPDPALVCERCGHVVDGVDPDDEVDSLGRPICGECARERDSIDFEIADNHDIDD